MSGHVQESQDRNQSEETEKHGGGDIALQRQAAEQRYVIGEKQPGGENQREANGGVNADSNRRVAKDVKPTITG